MRNKSPLKAIVVALALCSATLLAAYALAQTMQDTQQPAMQQQQDMNQPAQTTPSTPASEGAGPSMQQDQQEQQPILVPEGEECPPGTVPAGTISTPAAPGAGPTMEREEIIIEREEQPVMEMPARRYRPAGYGAGARMYMPRAGLDFGSLAFLGSSLIGAGLLVRRRVK